MRVAGASHRPRAAVIRPGSSPRLHARLASLVAEAFPDFVVDDIDIGVAMRERRASSYLAAGSAMVEYAIPLIRGRIHPRKAIHTSAMYARIVRSLVADRVSASTHAFSLQSQSLYSAATPGVPHFVYTDHVHLANLGYPGFDRSAFAPGRFLRREVELYRDAAMVFTRSNHVRDALIHGYGCDRDRIVVVGVGPNAEPTAVVPGWAGGRIIFIGVDWHRKGGPTLLRAFEHVRRCAPSARLEIVGCSPTCASGPGITVHGKLPMAAVAQLLGECDVFCLPTRAEPFGVAYIEAMLAGLPVVSSTIGAVDDFVIEGSTGYQVDCDDPDALAAALLRLINDPAAARRLGDNARRLASERYDWDVVMSKIRHHVVATLGAGICR